MYSARYLTTVLYLPSISTLSSRKHLCSSPFLSYSSQHNLATHGLSNLHYSSFLYELRIYVTRTDVVRTQKVSSSEYDQVLATCLFAWLRALESRRTRPWFLVVCVTLGLYCLRVLSSIPGFWCCGRLRRRSWSALATVQSSVTWKPFQ